MKNVKSENKKIDSKKQTTTNKNNLFASSLFGRLHPNFNYKKIEKMSLEQYDKLPLHIQKTFIRAKKNKLKNKKRKLVTRYSRAVLNNNVYISFEDPLDKKVKEKLSLDKYVVETKNLAKSYFSGVVENKVLKNLDFKLEKHDFLTILGPSGSGKTTLLNIVSGLDTVTRGDVYVDGINLTLLNDRDLTTFRKRKIGFVFQQYNLLPNLTAAENIEVGANLSVNKDKTFINNVIKTIGLKEHIKKYPYQLSGGQQQRVSIARALAKNPEILFCDEPTGALDEKTGRTVLEVLKKINKRFKTTIIIVTHNPNISKIAKTILKIRDGKIEQLVKNKNILDPKDISW